MSILLNTFILYQTINMATRTALLNGNVINRDTDFSKYIEAVSEPWVIEWLTVTASSVAVGKCFVPCERANGDIIYALVYNNSAQAISGDGDVYVEIPQELIDNWELANEDWSEIAEIKVGTMPSKNALLLATITSGVVEDKRNIINKVSEINNLETRMTNAEDEIDEIIEKWATNHLEETWLVWEKYTLNDKIFMQKTPTLSSSTAGVNIWDINDNKQIHIQRIASWTADNKIALKVKKVWAPTTWLVVEVRKWVQVNVSDTEAYWYGWELVCSGNISYDDFSTSYQEFEITMDWNFWWTRWELLDIVVYQTWNIVNSTNYYTLACDNTQYSEWFSYVAVNGDTRVRSKIMPYCVSNWLEASLLCKVSTAWSSTSTSLSFSVSTGSTQTKTYTTTQGYSTLYLVIDYSTNNPAAYGWTWWSITIKVWNSTVYTNSIDKWEKYSSTLKLTNIASWTTISVVAVPPSQSGQWWAYFNTTLSWTLSITANPSGIIKPLIPTEVKAIWEQSLWISYWRLPDWTRYWEFDWITHNSATTWSIALWNCIWFKIITDANGEKYKIPIYWI